MGGKIPWFSENRLLLGKHDGVTDRYYRMYIEAMKAVEAHLLGRSKPNGLLYIAETRSAASNPAATLDPKMDHLVCFAGIQNIHPPPPFDEVSCACMPTLLHIIGGMLALGAWHMDELRLPGIASLKERHMKLGSELTRTCYMLYHRSPTGIAPEIFHFNNPTADFS